LIELIIVLSIVVGSFALIAAMVKRAKTNERLRNIEVYASWKEHQYYHRLNTWRRKAKEWKIERKKKVKVQFD